MPDFQAPINSMLRTAAAAKVLKDKMGNDEARRMTVLTKGLEAPTPSSNNTSRYDEPRRQDANARALANTNALKNQNEAFWGKLREKRKEVTADGKQRENV